MPEQKYPPEFEAQVRKAMDMPEPNADAMDALRAQFIARGTAALKSDRQPDSASNPFRPEKESKMNRKTFFSSPRLAWGLTLLVLASLLALAFSSPTVVNALRRLLGYIPYIGVVEQDSSILVLAEPVTVERDGVILTVEQAIATLEKTIVIYRHIEDPVDYSNYQPPADYPEDRPALRLPDGSKLNVLAGQHQPDSGGGILYALEFPPLPQGTNEVTLELTRLAGLMPAQGPENWEVSLRFIYGDPSQIILPVIEYEPSPTAILPEETGGQFTQPAYGISITLDKAVELPDGYILMGSFQWTDTSIEPYGMSLGVPSIKDANGQELEFEFTVPERTPQPGEIRQYWAYKLIGTNLAAPISLAFAVQASIPVDGGSFTFDPGPNPQLGQKWDINQDVLVNNETIHVLSAEQAGIEEGFFLFTMQSDSNIVGASITDLAHPPVGLGGGGGSEMPQTGVPFYSGFGYQMPLPQGPYTLTFIRVGILVPGDWTVTWSPPAFAQQNPPVSATPSASFPTHAEACLTGESWRQALSKNEPIPSNLTGTLVLADPYEKISIVNLASGEQKVIGNGSSPSISPDGSLVAVTGPIVNSQPPNGLYVIDPASKNSTLLPGTTAVDSSPLWSPNGKMIAFTHGLAGATNASGPYQVMVMNADGSNLRQLTSDHEEKLATAWMPDSLHIVYLARHGLESASVRMVNSGTGEISPLLEISYSYGSVVISPDGRRVSYEDWLPGEIYALFVSNLDGSNRSLLAQGPEVTVVTPKWSPDGQWVIASVYEGNSDSRLALINVSSCQIVPLPNLSGYVGSWLP